jgi:hypothetical protein
MIEINLKDLKPFKQAYAGNSCFVGDVQADGSIKPLLIEAGETVWARNEDEVRNGLAIADVTYKRLTAPPEPTAPPADPAPEPDAKKKK